MGGTCQGNGKLARHCTARYKIEWIYTQTKMSGQGSLELISPDNEKERKNNKWLFFLTSGSGMYNCFDE